MDRSKARHIEWYVGSATRFVRDQLRCHMDVAEDLAEVMREPMQLMIHAGAPHAQVSSFVGWAAVHLTPLSLHDPEYLLQQFLYSHPVLTPEGWVVAESATEYAKAGPQT